MILKTIKDETGKSKLVVNQFFKDLYNGLSMVFNTKPANTSSFKILDNFKILDTDIQALEKYKQAVSEGTSTTDAFNLYMKETSLTAQEYANSVNLSTISKENFNTYSESSSISLQAEDKSLKNCVL